MGSVFLIVGKISKFFCVTAIICISYFMNKESNISVETFNSIEKEINTIEIDEVFSKEIIEGTYDLGERSFETDLGNTVYYNVRGLVSLPSGERKFPVVLILHGRHNNTSNDTRFDKGFKYLIDYLASCGYAVFTLDIQGCYNSSFGTEDDNKKVREMFPSFIKAFKDANLGVLNGFSLDLTEKLDLDNIVLIGHSRGGENAIDIALENKNIKGVISVAPTLPDKLDREYPDVPISIIVPEIDGDVSTLDGFSLFDSITMDKNRLSDVNLVFLRNANHNWFNSMLTKNDANYLNDEEKIKNQISRREQEQFLMSFSHNFLDNIFYNNLLNTINDYKTFEPTYMYGVEVKTQFWRKKQQIILDYNNYMKVNYKDVDIKLLRESIYDENDEVQGFILPLQNIDEFSYKDLINIKWRNRLGQIDIPIEKINFNKYDSLVLNLAIDSSDNLNTQNESQSFILRLEDNKGNVSEVTLGEESSALHYVEGKNKYIEDNKYYWSAYTILSDIRIPLEIFNNINLKNINKITLLFNQKNSGSIMINNIRLS